MSEQNTSKWLGPVVGIGVVVAIFTNPSLEQHQRQFQVAMAQAKQNAASSFSLRGWLGLSTLDVARGGYYENLYVMSYYHVTLAGQEVIRCTGFLGQVDCRTPKD